MFSPFTYYTAPVSVLDAGGHLLLEPFLSPASSSNSGLSTCGRVVPRCLHSGTLLEFRSDSRGYCSFSLGPFFPRSGHRGSSQMMVVLYFPDIFSLLARALAPALVQ